MSLSLAVIAKNAERTIGRCLESARSAVDEIVVVDTGSTDGTVRIAGRLADKMCHFKWVNDFSAARNYSFDKCTKDWILWLDADDYLLPEDAKKIKEFDYSDKEIIISPYEYAHDENGASICTVPRERIVKRSLGLRWEGRIHEYLPLKGKVFIPDRPENTIHVHHNKQQGSSERNLRILEEIVAENPNEARNLYYLGSECMDMNRIDDAITWLVKYVNHPEGYWEDKYQAHYKLAQCYMSKNEGERFKYHIFESIKIEERRAEPLCLLGMYYMGKDWGKAIQWYEAARYVRRPHDLLISWQPEYYTWIPYLQLTVCYNALGDIQKAYECNCKALEYRPNDSRMVNNDRILSKAVGARERAPEPARRAAGPPKEKTDGRGRKLNLGCGGKKLEGYVNVDLFPGPGIDEVFELDDIPYLDGTVGGIYSEHSLEHVTFDRVERALKEWHRALAPGGTLDLRMPDLEDSCRAYLQAPSDGKVNGYPAKQWYKYTIYGIQKSQAGEPDEAQVHRSGYSRAEMAGMLERIGFAVGSMEPYDGWGTLSFKISAVKPMSGPKIGWVSPANWDAAQTRLRVMNVDGWLRGHGYRSKVVSSYEEIVSGNYDLAIVGKSFSQEDCEKIRWLKGQGKTVYADVCESLFEFPWFKEVLSACDKVVCCSYKLEELVKPVNPNTAVIEEGWES